MAKKQIKVKNTADDNPEHWEGTVAINFDNSNKTTEVVDNG